MTSRHPSRRRRRRTSRLTRIAAGASAAAVALGLATAVGPAPASAAPLCPGAAPARLVGVVPGAALEGLTVDAGGRLYTTDLVSGRVYRLSGPGAPAVPIARVPGGSGAGALAWTPDGTLLVGYGSDPRVFVGDALRHASIGRLDVNTRAFRPWVTGLSAANGMDVSARGNVYATNDFGNLIGRVSPGGAVNAAWGALPSANGAVLSRDDRWLYVSRTFVNPGVSRISTADPRNVQSLLGVGTLSTPDGLTLDSRDRPVVPFNATGEIVRITSPGRYCVLATGLSTSSVLSYGRGDRGFSAGRLYRAGFDGRIYEIPGGFDRGATAAFPAR
ncbi:MULTISPECIES: SMP-30/gluconolactonase/LRE family protein [Gordonia]|uniref:SMP-30/gluconolactonase/LRE family protein n=1 Tax=Gordonia TaxID=2053 RepID=UPI0004172335|nr:MULTISPECIES: SMP-30/gluconolactonase/LRE family protein [Gordonia]KAF0970517.1 hypothetical protein BPODLACK_00786 [Gordonia sp. YY1]MCZ0913667.1 SMP-30/gluconolactonase/LRE family protein [Gordonia amicalis]